MVISAGMEELCPGVKWVGSEGYSVEIGECI
jgi:hypothetical protein